MLHREINNEEIRIDREGLFIKGSGNTIYATKEFGLFGNNNTVYTYAKLTFSGDGNKITCFDTTIMEKGNDNIIKAMDIFANPGERNILTFVEKDPIYFPATGPLPSLPALPPRVPRPMRGVLPKAARPQPPSATVLPPPMVEILTAKRPLKEAEPSPRPEKRRRVEAQQSVVTEVNGGEEKNSSHEDDLL